MSGDHDEQRSRTGRTGDRWLLALVAVLAVPYLIVAVRAVALDWTPISDNAFELLQMHDVGTRHTPLLGVYSRFGWNHPGPLFLWLYAPVLRLFGTSGVLAFTALVNLGWALLAVRGARRLGGVPLAAATAGVTALVAAASGPALLVDPWNPWLAASALLACFFHAADAAESGSTSSALIALVAGSFSLQTHVGTLPVVATAAVAATVWFVLVRPPVPRPGRTAAALAGTALVLWSGPIIQQIRGPQGNLAAIARFAARGSGEPYPELSKALGVAARELGVRPAWAGFGEVDQLYVGLSPIWTLAVVPALLAGLVVAARRDGLVVRLGATALLLHAAAIVAVTRTAGGLAPYVLRWTWSVGAFGAAVLLWGAWRVVAEPHPGASRADDGGTRWPVGVGVAAVSLLVLGAALPTAVSALGADLDPEPQLSRAADGVITALDPALPDASTFNARWNPAEGFAAVAPAVFSHLAGEGYDIRFPESWGPAAGRHRAGHDPGAPTLWIVSSANPWPAPEGAERLTSWSPLDPSDRAERDRLDASLRAALDVPRGAPLDLNVARTEGGPSIDRKADRLEALQARGEDYAVYLVPPSR